VAIPLRGRIEKRLTQVGKLTPSLEQTTEIPVSRNGDKYGGTVVTKKGHRPWVEKYYRDLR
jgi:hypothetical protein